MLTPKGSRTTQAFTLIELLIVIAIIGVLAAVVIPNLLNSRARAHDTAAQACAKSIAVGQTIYALDNDGTFGAALADLNADTTAGCLAPGIVVTPGATWQDGWSVEHANGNTTYTIGPAGLN